MLKDVKPTERHVACMARLKAALDPALSAEELLALASQLVGNLTALQDQRKYSPAAVMGMVSRNIEIGNREACREVLSATAPQVGPN